MAKNDREKAQKFAALNRRARFDYTIQDTMEAGLLLVGTEVKALRAGGASIQEAYAGQKDGKIYLLNAHIPEYPLAGRHLQHETKRPRLLLLHNKQIEKLLGAIKRDGVTLVPMALYFNKRGLAKLELGLGKGKNKVDKRDAEKKKDWQREKGRLMREKG
jgi:SsrA-binding protein